MNRRNFLKRTSVAALLPVFGSKVQDAPIQQTIPETKIVRMPDVDYGDYHLYNNTIEVRSNQGVSIFVRAQECQLTSEELAHTIQTMVDTYEA